MVRFSDIRAAENDLERVKYHCQKDTLREVYEGRLEAIQAIIDNAQKKYKQVTKILRNSTVAMTKKRRKRLAKSRHKKGLEYQFVLQFAGKQKSEVLKGLEAI